MNNSNFYNFLVEARNDNDKMLLILEKFKKLVHDLSMLESKDPCSTRVELDEDLQSELNCHLIELVHKEKVANNLTIEYKGKRKKDNT